MKTPIIHRIGKPRLLSIDSREGLADDNELKGILIGVTGVENQM